MRWFVKEGSIVRKIWGQTDTILFIFAGAAAEFALNKAVDWLYFTGRLPADPLGRLFSTVTYARRIVFSSERDSHSVIDQMAIIHKNVEQKRGSKIPAWAYRDVLYMLIDYSIRSWELLHNQLTNDEKAEVYDVFRRVGERMGLEELPADYDHWLTDRKKHIHHDLQVSVYTKDLYSQYRKHLGFFRYRILLAAQGSITPPQIKKQLGLSYSLWFRFVMNVYKIIARFKLDWYLKQLILPGQYIQQVKTLETR